MRVLRVRGFAALLAGQSVNAIGNWIAIIAIWGFAAFEFDAGPGDLAFLFVVLSIPGAFLGPFLGVVIDRIGPRRALIAANALGIVAALALSRAQSYSEIILLALPLGLIEAMASASLDALPPRLVADEDLVRANALLGGAQDLAIVIGPIIAAIVNVRWGLPGAFIADAATFAVGLLVVLPLRVDPLVPAAHESGVVESGVVESGVAGSGAAERRSVARSSWSEVVYGFRLVRRSAELRWTMGVATVTFCLWATFGILEPLYVREVLGESDTVFALLQTVFGAGLVLASIALAQLGDRAVRPRYVAVATIVSGATAALYLGTQSLAVAYFGVFLWGLDVAFFYIPAKTLLQRYSPIEAHGRIMSLNQSLEPFASIVVTPVVAIAVGVIGVQAMGVVGGVLAAGAGVLALRAVVRLAPPPPSGAGDPLGSTSRDAIALGAAAPGS